MDALTAAGRCLGPLHGMPYGLKYLFDTKGIVTLVGPFETGPMLVASNFTGHPCLHLRAGFNRFPTRDRRTLTDGPVPTDAAPDAPVFEVPQGISLWGRLFDEGRLLSLGIALERVLGVVDLRPDIATGRATQPNTTRDDI